MSTPAPPGLQGVRTGSQSTLDVALCPGGLVLATERHRVLQPPHLVSSVGFLIAKKLL